VSYSRQYYADNKKHIVASIMAYQARTRKTKPWLQLVKNARTRANVKALPFDLTDEWAAARFTGHCELTGLPFRSYAGAGSRPRAFSPSIDRIDPALGYVQGNCRFILFGLNALRGTGTDQEMLQIAGALLEAAERGCALGEGLGAKPGRAPLYKL